MEIKGYRTAVDQVNAYVAGKSISEVQKHYGLERVVKLGSNENPYGPFTHARQAMIKEIENLYLYPDNTYQDLKVVLGKLNNLPSENIALSHGAGGMLETLAKTFIEAEDEVILSTQTYGLYREISRLMGGRVREISLNSSYQVDLADVRNSINEKTKLIWLCNPNNPTGTVVNKADFANFLNDLREDIWVVLDEAYAEFADQNVLPDSLRHVRDGKNLIIVRTLSKAYALAGARIGYAIADPSMIRLIETVAEPFNANRIGLVGAIASLTDDQAEYETALAAIVRDRDQLISEMRKMGFECPDSQTNFFFVRIPYNAKTLGEAMLRKGVIIRPCGGWGYPNFVRVTVGTSEENEIFLMVFKDVLQEMAHDQP